MTVLWWIVLLIDVVFMDVICCCISLRKIFCNISRWRSEIKILHRIFIWWDFFHHIIILVRLYKWNLLRIWHVLYDLFIKNRLRAFFLLIYILILINFLFFCIFLGTLLLPIVFWLKLLFNLTLILILR